MAQEDDLPFRTPDRRYIIVRGRLWRATNPELPAALREESVKRLMAARRAKRVALKTGDRAAVEAAKVEVEAAKRALGERGPVWWGDGAADQNRKLIKNSTYAKWWAEQTPEGA